MKTYIVYFDETGDDGVSTASSDTFVLTSLYMSAEKWQHNYEAIRACRAELKQRFGFHISEELHTKYLLTDKEPYRKYEWTPDEKREIIKIVTKCIGNLEAQIINVIIDKTAILHQEYPILANALKYNIQRIENDSAGNWNYIIITDTGRLPPMRSTARAIRAYNPIQSKFSLDFTNQPIRGLIEDILEKDSKESYFIQMCDFVSYMVHLYYKTQYKSGKIPNRARRIIDNDFVKSVMATLKARGVLNLKATGSNGYGLVIYPKKA